LPHLGHQRRRAASSSGYGNGPASAWPGNPAFDRYWQWANKLPESTLTIPADIHHAITSLPPEARGDRATVNEGVRKLGESKAHLYDDGTKAK
jgi:hypothetical protein